MNSRKINILLSSRSPETLRDDIRAVVPDAQFFVAADLDSDPSIVESLDIVYGKLEPELFPQAKRLKWLQTTSAGVDWTMSPEVQSHPAIVTNAGIHAAPISEYLFGVLLMLTRGLHVAHKNQAEHTWDRSPYREVLDELPGKTLCVVGLGRIGQRCAALGEAFGMRRVIGVRRRAQPTPHVEKVYDSDNLIDALAEADVIMVILPGTPETRGMFGQREFAAMRKGCYFLNAGRGSTVDQQALLESLRDGTVRGAGLDVFDPEPLPPDSPLWDMPNVIITPHISGLHPNYGKHTAEIFLDNLRRFLAGEPLRYVVDKAQGY